MVRLHAEGWNVKSIAPYLKTARSTVYRTLRRWIEEGLTGLDDRPNTGGSFSSAMAAFTRSLYASSKALSAIQRDARSYGSRKLAHGRLYSRTCSGTPTAPRNFSQRRLIAPARC